MNLKILSDLHIEHGEPRHLDAIKHGDEDVLICAGDVSNNGPRGLYWLRARFPDTRIVFVPGNHEYYCGKAINELNEEMIHHGKSLGIDVLINDSVEIDGVEFIGSTLWSNFGDSPFSHESRIMSERYVNDFRLIRVNDTERLRAYYVETKLFDPAYNFLSKALHSENENQVVITHFAPAHGSIAKQFAGDPITPYFVNNIEELITRRSALFIHGHTHTAFDYQLSDSRVICNPSGYRGEGSQFDPNLIVEV